MQKVDHTFVIPAYKESVYLEECILSLKNQTMKSEIVIATSTPSDFLSQIAQKYEIPVYVNEKSDGIGSDWSFAYSVAKTDYVTLAHQDDTYAPNYTESCLNAARRFAPKDSLIVFTDYFELYGGKLVGITPSLMVKKILLSFFLTPLVRRSCYLRKRVLSFGSAISCPCVTYNKRQLGPFVFSNDYLVSLDWDTWLRIAEVSGTFVYVPKRLMVHRIHEDSEAAIQTKEQIRKKEDTLIFYRLWPKPVAKLLSTLYYLSSVLIERKMDK